MIWSATGPGPTQSIQRVRDRKNVTKELSGRRVVICGAAGGIGAAAVRGFVERGAVVAALYNTTPPTPDLADLALWRQCDLADKAAVDQVFDEVVESLGGLDVLIQPAGTWRAALPESAEESEIDFLINANLKSTIFTNQAAFRHMKAGGGRIVNFGSIEGVDGSPMSSVYAATRGAVQAWTRSAARAWGQHGINVNAIAPIMHTALYEYALTQMDEGRRINHERELAQRIPIGGKFGDPLRDCVPVLAFLASEGSRFITGQLIPVDGGMMMVGA